MTCSTQREKHYHYTISLRVEHPNIDPAEITSAMGLAPKYAWRAGEPCTSKRRATAAGTHAETYWTLELDEGAYPARELVAAISDIADQLSPHADFFRRIRAEGGSIELFIGWFFDRNSGDVLTHDLMARLAALGVDLHFDIYPPERM